ncbi:excalibur calcium-binding domain-containing protein [Agrilutibacter niabensis]|uniref:excalibur calcium-binding domain-containing protein n=1 Tax=Agrilutibacter niabensis TaxID=380628 RepID=UPI0031F2D5D9
MTTPRALVLGALVLTSETVAAHGGGLDANGCHHDRKHGGYHCHRGSPPRMPIPNFAPTPMPRQRLTGADNDSIYYANCSAARAAGATPVRRGDPGYGRHLDRDGDGVGCE